MIHRCAWCKRITAPEDGRAPVGEITDGICPECAEKLAARSHPAPTGHLARAFARTGYRP
jgi:hypothetical protein